MAKPTHSKSAGKKSAKKKPQPYDDDGRLIARMEAQLFHAEDREEGDEARDEDAEDADDEVSERTVYAALDPDGTLTVLSFERDTSARMHGDDDEEEFGRTITVPEHVVARLAFELVRERFGGAWRGDEDFADFCAAHDIPFEDAGS